MLPLACETVHASKASKDSKDIMMSTIGPIVDHGKGLNLPLPPRRLFPLVVVVVVSKV